MRWHGLPKLKFNFKLQTVNGTGAEMMKLMTEMGMRCTGRKYKVCCEEITNNKKVLLGSEKISKISKLRNLRSFFLIYTIN